MMSYDSEAILLSDLVMNRLRHYHASGFITDEEYFKLERKGSVDSVTNERLRYYHDKGWITDKEFLKFETDVEIGDICDFIDERAQKLLKDICDKEKEAL